jgi:mannonate dehydratase
MLEQTWRWFRPLRPDYAAGNTANRRNRNRSRAALRIPDGDMWNRQMPYWKEKDILIESAGLRWSVIESIPVHEDIKRRSGNYARFIANLREFAKRRRLRYPGGVL